MRIGCLVCLMISLPNLNIINPMGFPSAAPVPELSFSVQKAPTLCLAGWEGAGRTQDDQTFILRARWLAQMLGGIPYRIHSGQELLERLSEHTRLEGAVGNLILFAHGDPHGCFFTPQQGLYHPRIQETDSLARIYGGGGQARTVEDLAQWISSGKIRVAEGSVWLLITCQGADLARNITQMTGIPTVATEGRSGPLNAPDLTAETGVYHSDSCFEFNLPTAIPRTIRTLSLDTLLDPAAFLSPDIRPVHGGTTTWQVSCVSAP